MPTFRHGKNAVFKLDNAAGTLTDISNVLNEVSLSRDLETGETTSFGSSAKSYVPGLTDSTLSISGSYDATVDAHIQAVLAAMAAGTVDSASFEYGPEGSTSSRLKMTGECIITSYETSSPVGDVVTFSLELQNTGAVTRGTY
jgi:hypothetical protein